jgi:hypothetical protein
MQPTLSCDSMDFENLRTMQRIPAPEKSLTEGSSQSRLPVVSPLKKREPGVEMVLQAPLPDSPNSVTGVLLLVGDFSRNDDEDDEGASVEQAKFYQISYASEPTTDGIVAYTVPTPDLTENDMDDATEYSRDGWLKGLSFISDDLCGASDISED